MNTLVIDNENIVQNKLYAVLDARAQNARNVTLYSETMQNFANSMFENVQRAYANSKCYLSYRQNFIAIKVHAPLKGERISNAVVALDLTIANTVNATRVTTTQGHIIYRLNV